MKTLLWIRNNTHHCVQENWSYLSLFLTSHALSCLLSIPLGRRGLYCFELFYDMFDRRKELSLIYNWEHCRKFSPLQISDLPSRTSEFVELSCSAAIRKWTHSHEVYFFLKSASIPSTSSTSSIENNSRKIIPNPLIATETKKYWWLHFQKTAGLFSFYFLFFFSLISDFESCLRLMSVLNQCGKFKIICN